MGNDLKTKLNISDLEAQKPMAIDSQGKLLTLDDLAEQKPYMSLATLEPGQQVSLVLARYDMEPDFEVSILQGDRIGKSQVMKLIEDQTDFGIEAMRAELRYLSDIHSEIEGVLGGEELPESHDLGSWPPQAYKWVPKKYWPWFFKRYAVFTEDTDTSITNAAAQYRKRYVIPCFKNRAQIAPIILTGVNDTRPNFANACKRRGVVYISGVGHGSPIAYTGYQYDRLWEVCKYDAAEVKGKIIHLLSCKTAQELGPDLVRKGACAYFGYAENFTITWNHPDAFWKCDSSIDLALCNGLNAGAAAKVAIYVYNHYIRQYRGIHGPTAAWLTHDRDALRTPLHDAKYGSKNCTLRRVPIFEEIEAQIAEEAIEDFAVVEAETVTTEDLLKYIME